MDNCSRNPVGKGVKIDDKAVKEHEYRKTSRLWEKVVKKHSSSAIDGEDDGRRGGVRFRSGIPHATSENFLDLEGMAGLESSAPAEPQVKVTKAKGLAKKKSPLQKFDEIVTRELTSRQAAEEEGRAAFEGSSKWSSMDFTRSKIPGPARKLSFDTKMSKTTLHNVEKDLKNWDRDPSDVENCALMDAIEKLIQAQASYRFDVAAKAAEAAASSVPIELAEEVAISSTKDYQSQIIDIVNEKLDGRDGHKPMEIIGYIGITKQKETVEEED